jgi:hypothetical protein
MNIKQLLKSAAYWTVPTGVYELLLKQFQGLRKEGTQLSREDKALLDKNILLKDRHKGKRCFIICNGPSINKQDLKLLKNEISFSVSNGYLHKDYNIYKPSYHVLPTVYSKYFDENTQLKWFKEMDQATRHQKVFLSYDNKDLITKQSLFSDRVFFLRFRKDLKKGLHDGIDLTKDLPVIRTVPHICIFIAIYMGFNKIYLLGCDHDSILQGGKHIYFYDEKESLIKQVLECSFETHLRNYVKLIDYYKIVKSYTERRGIKIYNATAGGLLDVFPRVKFESLFQQ